MRAGAGALIFFLILSSFAAGAVAPTKAELEAMYAAAAQDFNAGQYRDALKKLDAIDERQPDLAAAQNLRGVALMRLTEYRQAESALRKARGIDPNFWEARFNLAEVQFLAGNWTLARSRFTELLAEPNEHLQGATRDLIQFKILLTCLLEEKEKLAAAALEKLKSSPESPALYYAQAALALRRKDLEEAKAWMATAAKEYSPQLNRLFTESFYEVRWLPKPKEATPVALEVSSQEERVARAQADLARAERAFRQRDFEGAWKFLDQVDAVAPDQAVADNLRGEILLEQGKIDEAERALRNALAADPQLLSARYNLARVPFARKNFAVARKELEALLGAFSGAGAERRGQLLRYQIYLTLLLEGHEGAAQKALDEFKMMDDSPALYYAQAAWAFQHGHPKQGKNWVANAGNLFPAELNRSFASPLADLGWLNHPAATAAATPAATATPEPMVVKNELPKTEPVAAPTVAPTATATATPAPVVAEASPSPVEVEKEVAENKSTPAPTPDISPSPKKSARAETERSKEPSEPEKPAKKPSARKRTKAPAGESSGRSSSTAPLPPPQPVPTATPVRENIGDKVKNFFLYPFKRPLLTPTPGPVRVTAPAAAKPSPTPSSGRRRNN